MAIDIGNGKPRKKIKLRLISFCVLLNSHFCVISLSRMNRERYIVKEKRKTFLTMRWVLQTKVFMLLKKSIH